MFTQNLEECRCSLKIENQTSTENFPQADLSMHDIQVNKNSLDIPWQNLEESIATTNGNAKNTPFILTLSWLGVLINYNGWGGGLQYPDLLKKNRKICLPFK